VAPTTVTPAARPTTATTTIIERGTPGHRGSGFSGGRRAEAAVLSCARQTIPASVLQSSQCAPCADPAAAQSGGLFSTLFGTLGSRQPAAPRQWVPYASLDPSANAPAVSITVTPAVRPPDWAALFSTASKALQRAMSREPNQDLRRECRLSYRPGARAERSVLFRAAHRLRLPRSARSGLHVQWKRYLRHGSHRHRDGSHVAPGRHRRDAQGSKGFHRIEAGRAQREGFQPVENRLGRSADLGRKPATVSVATPNELRHAAQ
jgi:hypothetical protein